MERIIHFSDEAEFDLSEAFCWYEMQRKGLGLELELSIEACLHSIARNPKGFQVKYKKIHVVFGERFPYGIHYLIELNVVKVIAIFYVNRDPQIWKTRK